MTLEMISGPDLGGGFLFQLSVDRSMLPPRVVVHAQEGGMDASGPPKGSPTPFGFSQSEGSCPLGGRDCYHREFELPEDEIPRARLAYNRLRFVFGPMLEQRYARAEVPVEAGLGEIVDRIGPWMEKAGRPWFIGGSTAAFLQGVPTRPRDIDLGTDRPGVLEVAHAIPEYLIEPPAPTTWPTGRAMFAARAYVGTLVSGVRVEWGVPEDATGEAEPYSEWSRVLSDGRVRRVAWGERSVPVSPLEFYLVRSAVRRATGPMAATAKVVRARGVEAPLLDELLERSPLSPAQRSEVRSLVAA
jgi:hypothetical protein